MEAKMASEKVVVSAPMSYHGSAARLWKLVEAVDGPARVVVALGVSMLVMVAWLAITSWYMFFGVLLVPYRLIRRGSRKRKVEGLRHREMLDALQQSRI